MALVIALYCAAMILTAWLLRRDARTLLVEWRVRRSFQQALGSMILGGALSQQE